MVIKKLIVHCSDSGFGTAELINKWHTEERGWSAIGYHFVITNGVFVSGKPYNQKQDGIVQKGRSVERSGAHCRGHNRSSLGICMIGKEHFSDAQRIALMATVLELCGVHELEPGDVYGHYEFDDGKSCPNMSMGVFREDLGFRLKNLRTNRSYTSGGKK